MRQWCEGCRRAGRADACPAPGPSNICHALSSRGSARPRPPHRAVVLEGGNAQQVGARVAQGPVQRVPRPPAVHRHGSSDAPAPPGAAGAGSKEHVGLSRVARRGCKAGPAQGGNARQLRRREHRVGKGHRAGRLVAQQVQRTQLQRRGAASQDAKAGGRALQSTAMAGQQCRQWRRDRRRCRLTGGSTAVDR